METNWIIVGALWLILSGITSLAAYNAWQAFWWQQYNYWRYRVWSFIAAPLFIVWLAFSFTILFS